MMKKSLYKATLSLSIAAMLAVVVAACSSEETPAFPPSLEDDTFTVTAEIAQQLYSRAYQDDGEVKEGIYYLSYPLNNQNNSYNVASVEFDKEGTTPGIGIVTVPNNQALEWKDVGGGPTPTFYLDNVSATDNASPTRITLGEDNPYKAAIFDDKDGKNDLLWGETMVSRNAKNIYFDLHHNMSRVRVQVTVNHTNNDLDLTGATVEISSINQKPIAYNRLDGSLELPTATTEEERQKIYTTLTLVNYSEEAEEKIEWASSSIDEKDQNISIYTTKDFVLPPQDILGDENRPKLTITLKNGTVYSGILPHAMLIDDGTNVEPSYPVAFSFLKEHILTIRTLITEEPPQLGFMPVWVVDWVDKGDFTIEAHQSGIYKPEEFYKLIEYYNENNEYQLPRYGRLTPDGKGGEKWEFDFFHFVTLDYDKIHAKMKVGENVKGSQTKDFSFDFNAYTVSIQKYDSDGNPYGEPHQTDPYELYQIVTGAKAL